MSHKHHIPQRAESRTPVLVPFVSLLLATALLASCSHTIDEVSLFDEQHLPQQTLRGAHIYQSEKGQIQAELISPLIIVYREPEPLTLFPQGLTVHFFDDDSLRTPRALFTADSALRYDEQGLFHAFRNVRLIDHRSHDTVYLDDLVWDAHDHRIYSDHPLRAVNAQRVTYGDRFESDEHLTNPQIYHQRGTVEWNDDPSSTTDTTP